MNCQRVQMKLSAFVDGELTGVESLEIRDHLNRCTTCQRELRSVQQVKALLSEMVAPEPRPGFESKLALAVFSAEKPAMRESFWRLGLVAGVAATVVVFAALQIITTRNQHTTDLNRHELAQRNATNFTVSQDTAYFAGADPLSPQAPVMTTAYGDR